MDQFCSNDKISSFTAEQIATNKSKALQYTNQLITSNPQFTSMVVDFPFMRFVLVGLLDRRALKQMKSKSRKTKNKVAPSQPQPHPQPHPQPQQLTSHRAISMARSVLDKLLGISEDPHTRATHLVNQLTMNLLTTSNPESAVDALRLANPCLHLVFEEYEFILPFLNTIAKVILLNSKFGVRMRVFLGAVLSSGDAITDIFVIFKYMRDGISGKASALILMLASTILAQLFLTNWQFHKCTRGKRLYEFAITALFLRPAVDAYRLSVSSRSKTTFHYDQTLMASLTRMSELVFESVPGAVLQVRERSERASMKTRNIYDI